MTAQRIAEIVRELNKLAREARNAATARGIDGDNDECDHADAIADILAGASIHIENLNS